MSNIELPAMGWRPRPYQLPLWRYLEGGGKRAAVVWPRRHGKDLTAINWTAWASQTRVGLYWLVYPFLNMGRRIAWQGMDKTGKKFIDAFPQELIKNSSNAEMRLDLKNGSVIQIMGADQPDRFVGANPIGMVFSEWSLMDPQVWKLTAPILAENDGWALWIYTPRGSNHGLTLLNTAKERGSLKNNDPECPKGKWFWSHLNAANCRVLTKENLYEARAELKDEALFQQEFFTSFEAPMQGAYYDTQMNMLMRKKLIREFPVDPKLQVGTAWDIGYSDHTSIWFWQRYGPEIRLIDYYTNSGEGLAHYVKVLQEKQQEEGWLYGEHLFPWDVAKHDFASGKTTTQVAREMGLKVTPVTRLAVDQGIEAVRNMLPRCLVHKTNCMSGIDALKSYRKDWDEKNQTFKKTPLHDWASHGADALRTLAVGLRDRKYSKGKRPEQNFLKDYNPFSF